MLKKFVDMRELVVNGDDTDTHQAPRGSLMRPASVTRR